MARDVVDFALISNNPQIIARCKAVCDEFQYSFKSWPTPDALFEEESTPTATLVIVSSIDSKENDAAGLIQVAKQIFQDSFIGCIVSKAMDPKTASFAKKSGANSIILENEVFESSKLEFLGSQVIKATYFPIKTSDLVANAPVPFQVFHLLPMKKKFLPCVHEDDLLTAEKLAQISSVGEMYIHRSSAAKFNEYSAKHVDMSAAGLIRRCRGSFLALQSSYTELVFLLTDQGEYASFQQGQALLNQCQQLARELSISLGSAGDAWSVINGSSVGESGSIERAPAIASYAAVFGLMLGVDPIDEVMVAALLADIGLLLVHPKIMEKIRYDKMPEFTPEERGEYEKHPIKSLNIALERKLPIPEALRNMILTTHEFVDGSGFPNKPQAHKISKGAQLIQISELLDRATALKLGKTRIPVEKLRQTFFKDHIRPGMFSDEILIRLERIFD